jgi:hypothetical protein
MLQIEINQYIYIIGIHDIIHLLLRAAATAVASVMERSTSVAVISKRSLDRIINVLWMGWALIFLFALPSSSFRARFNTMLKSPSVDTP